MTLVDQQFELLTERKPGAVLTELPDGAYLVTVPNIELPDGWSKKVVTVKFMAPVGYPQSKPDCFWTDHDLRLQNGGVPQNTGATPIPHVGGTNLWFSWHVAMWSPNTDNLLTYMNVIKRRLHDPR